MSSASSVRYQYPQVFKLTGWNCPAQIPGQIIGDYRIVKLRHLRGYYLAHDTLPGIAYFYIGKPFRYTALQELRDGVWRDWMTDEPLHWHSMAQLARLVTGPRVLVLGLGLGLVLRHLRHRPDIEQVTVIERSPEVVAMTWPHVEWPKAYVIGGTDFFTLSSEWTDTTVFSDVIADFWVGSSSSKELQDLFLKTYAKINEHWPTANQHYHGLQPWADWLGRLRLTDPDRPLEEVFEQARQIVERGR